MESKNWRPSCTKPTWLHADRTPRKVTSSGFMPSRCICSKSLRASWPCPCWAHPTIITVHETTSRFCIILNTLCESSILPHLEYMSTRAFPTDTSNSNPVFMM
eukprot:Gb_09356 [translate_table: standard]